MSNFYWNGGLFMDIINSIIANINNLLWTYILIILLTTLGLLFTFKSNFVQFRYLKEMFKLLGEGTSKNGDKNQGDTRTGRCFCVVRGKKPSNHTDKT